MGYNCFKNAVAVTVNRLMTWLFFVVAVVILTAIFSYLLNEVSHVNNALS